MVIPRSAKILLFTPLAAMTGVLLFGQTVAPNPVEVKLTGIVLTSHRICSDTKKQEETCRDRDSDWALASGRTTYLLFGDKSTLERFVRQRVIVSGLLQQGPVEINGLQMIRREIAIRSIEGGELSEQEIEATVKQLKAFPWHGQPMEECNRGCWNDFAFTDAMIEILQAGRAAQSALLRHLSDESIEDQIVMLLGGVGDENAIQPIVETLTDGDDAVLDEKSKRLNMVGRAALRNLTVVGAGSCEFLNHNTPRTCWSKWWLDHKNTFKEDVLGFRRISEYPNYGIYYEFEGASLR